MNEQEKLFETYLLNKRLKLTKTRKLILDTIFKMHEHFDVELLYDAIRKISTEVSRATIYRAIPLLLEAGLIQHSMRGDSREFYEHIYGHPKHIHWICRNCKSVVETDLNRIKPVLDAQAKQQSFDIEQIKLTVEGLCWKCQSSENESQ